MLRMLCGKQEPQLFSIKLATSCHAFIGIFAASPGRTRVGRASTSLTGMAEWHRHNLEPGQCLRGCGKGSRLRTEEELQAPGMVLQPWRSSMHLPSTPWLLSAPPSAPQTCCLGLQSTLCVQPKHLKHLQCLQFLHPLRPPY